MSRQEVMDAVANYLTQATVSNGLIPNLSSVFKYPPKVTQESQWFNNLPPGVGTGAVVYIALPHQQDTRIALGGAHSGIKWVQYECMLSCFLRYNGPTSEEACADADDFIDGLIAYLRADRNLGTAPVVGNEIPDSGIFQAGEGGDHGGVDLECEVFMPSLTNDGQVLMFFWVRMQVCQTIAS